MTTLPLTGSLLDEFNNLPSIPPDDPLGDIINTLAAGMGGGGANLVSVPAVGTGVPLPTGTPELIGQSADFTTTSAKTIAAAFGAVLVGSVAGPSAATFTVNLVDAGAVVVASFSRAVSVIPTGDVLLTPALIGSFGAAVPAGTYHIDVRVTLNDTLTSDGGGGLGLLT